MTQMSTYSRPRDEDEHERMALTPPKTNEQRVHQAVWSQILGIPKDEIGLESSFKKLGGDSIRAMLAASRCIKRGVPTNLMIILTGLSLEDVASTVPRDQSGYAATAGIVNSEVYHDQLTEPAPELDSFVRSYLEQHYQSNALLQPDMLERVVPATDTQSLMFRLGQLDSKSFRYVFRVKFSQSVRRDTLRRACEELTRHHAILRTVFFQRGATFCQAVLKHPPVDTLNEIVEREASPTITCQPGSILARFHLLREYERCSYLSLEIHHAIYDAYSIGLILSDLDAIFSSKPLSNGPQFYSWVSYVESLDKSEAQDYWKTYLQGSLMRSLVEPTLGKTNSPLLDAVEKFSVPIRSVSNSFGTPSSVFKFSWSVLLSCALGIDDVVFGEVSTNRYLPIAGLEEVRGPCINLVPVRVCLESDLRIASLITQLEDQSVMSRPYHHLGYKSIMEDCAAWASETRFNSLITYQNHGLLNPSLVVGDVNCLLSVEGTPGSTCDVMVVANPGTERLDVEIYYSSSTFSDSDIAWISTAFSKILEEMPSILGDRINLIQDAIKSSAGLYRIRN